MLLLCGCGAPSPPPQRQLHAITTDAGATIVGDTRRTVLTLVRTRCFGLCPTYRVSVDEDGKVVFDGDKYVARTGRTEWTVDPQIPRRLIEHMRALCADGSCLEPGGCDAFDVPQAGVQLTLPQGIQTIVTCSERENPHPSNDKVAFENEIDLALATAPFVTCDPKAEFRDAGGIACGEAVPIPHKRVMP